MQAHFNILYMLPRKPNKEQKMLKENWKSRAEIEKKSHSK